MPTLLTVAAAAQPTALTVRPTHPSPAHPTRFVLSLCPQWVEELFSAVPGGRGPRPQYGSAGFPYEGGRLYLLPAVRDEHRLTASFQLPCMDGKYRCGGGVRGGEQRRDLLLSPRTEASLQQRLVGFQLHLLIG